MDRDGVINRITPGNYIRHIAEFRLLPKVAESLGKLTRAGYEIHIISNQQGVAKGLMTRTQLSEITQLLMERVEKAGGKLTSVNYCIHLESEKCACRKPKTGLFRQATKGRKIDFRKTWMVGDSWRDIEAGQTMGCKTVWLGITPAVPEYSAKKKSRTINHEEHQFMPDYCVKNLAQAVQIILKSDAS